MSPSHSPAPSAASSSESSGGSAGHDHAPPLRRTGALGIAATFIGTTIGAGYASGQEILQYFVSFGLLRGFLALGIAGVLFFTLAAIVLLLAQRLRTALVHDIINPTRFRILSFLVDLTITVSLIGTLVIMLAGAGAALQGSLGWPVLVGAGVMALASVLSVSAGVHGLVRVQAVVVPAIIVVAVGVSVWGILNPGENAGGDVAGLVNTSPMINQWWMAGVLYVAFNVQLALAVFAPLGRESSSPTRSLVTGAGLGAMGLVVMAAAIMVALTAHAQLIGRAELPMVDLAAQIGLWAAVVYTVVLLLAQFTTALSCLYGASARLQRLGALRRVPLWAVATALAVITTALSAVGFSDLVGVVYPALGYAGLLIVALLVFSWFTRHRRDVSETTTG
ncbi:MAG: hypothetical protein Q4G34_07120 [Micrococcus sp.]|nr:hypothetical protein [Micrococcus sp.]